MTTRSWKRSESEIAARLGGQRVPITGRNGTDIAYPRLAIEVKSRTSLPAAWREWMRQARAGAPEGRLPCVVMHEAGRRHDEDLVLMRLADFANLEKEGGGANGRT